ncbi:hypothetical protein BaRGS_00002825 [Batillaria attramentaria]|uniref:Chitin-binding type-2 domain-containing protein n=1 Tax=Batillaria attramentaria TaxID=370345 RepID=A0ABD0M4B1_9CAEN
MAEGEYDNDDNNNDNGNGVHELQAPRKKNKNSMEDKVERILALREKISELEDDIEECRFYFWTALGFDCAGVADGVYEAGCKSFTVCANGVATLTECDRTQVYNSATGACADEGSVGPPCGTLKDCTTLADGKYADTDQQCTSYYTCAGGTFFGHNFCAGGLVFNEDKQTCDWPDDTDPPCGTKGQGPTRHP